MFICPVCECEVYTDEDGIITECPYCEESEGMIADYINDTIEGV